MEEAGDRVDSNIEEMKREYEDRIRKMEILLKKVRRARPAKCAESLKLFFFDAGDDCQRIAT